MINMENGNPIPMGQMAQAIMDGAYSPDSMEEKKPYRAYVNGFYNLRSWMKEDTPEQREASAIPTIKVVYDPFLPNRNYSAVVFYSVNSGGESHAGQRDIETKAEWLPPNLPHLSFSVFDVDLPEVKNPKVSLKDLVISASDVLVFPQSVTRAYGYKGPRVVDEHVRNRINEYWMNNKLKIGDENQIDVDHFNRLRRAATNKKACPGFGEWTYQFIKEDLSKDYDEIWIGSGYKKQKHTPHFKESDLKWLEEHMAHQGIPIPEA